MVLDPISSRVVPPCEDWDDRGGGFSIRMKKGPLFKYLFEQLGTRASMMSMNTSVPQCPNEIGKKAALLSAAADPTRLRILCFMFDRDEACVSDIAEALDMSVAAISHHLQIMKEHDIFNTERKGTKIVYRLVDNNFMKLVKGFVCGC